jgi:hypothetical protein
LKDNLMVASIAAFVVGAVLILIAEVGGVDQARVFGAALIALGGVGIGMDTGLADPRRLRVPEWLRHWRSTIGVVATVLAVAPVLVVLLGILAGIFGDETGDRSGLLMAVGAIISILMLAAVVATALISVQSIVRAARGVPSPNDPAELDAEGSGR